MLAQNFKTPADLGITDAEFDALAKVLGMLERGEVRHVEVGDSFQFYDENRPLTRDFLFNMDNLYTVADCGTAACIAGTSDLFCGTKFIRDDVLREGLPFPLKHLFMPPICDDEWRKITVEQAAVALRSYLTHGDPRWDEALA